MGSQDIHSKEAFFNFAKQIHIHPEYDLKTHLNDIALIKLAKKIDFIKMSNIRSLCLPSPNAVDINEKKPYAFVAGWGSTSDRHCKTTQDGPEKFKVCRFPFAYKDGNLEIRVNI